MRAIAATLIASALVGCEPAAESEQRVDPQELKTLRTQVGNDPYAVAKLAEQDHDKAVRLVLGGLQEDPSDIVWASALTMLGTLDSSDPSRHIKSLKYLERSMEIMSKEPVNPAVDTTRLLAMKAAIAANELDRAEDYAQTALQRLPEGWNRGNVIHDANEALGRISLRRGDAKKAAEYLLKAGQTPGSPQLNSFGPRFLLAKELLQARHQKPVLEYLALVEKFWASGDDRTAKLHQDQLAEWRQIIKNGDIPSGPNWP